MTWINAVSETFCLWEIWRSSLNKKFFRAQVNGQVPVYPQLKIGCVIFLIRSIYADMWLQYMLGHALPPER